MASAEAGATGPIGRMFLGTFVGFFLGPVILVTTLMISDPERVTYRNGGLVLLFSVVAGAVCGAAIGAASTPRVERNPAMIRLKAEVAGALTGGVLGGVALSANPGVGALAGALFGAISGGLLANDAARPGPFESVPPDDQFPLWDRDLDA